MFDAVKLTFINGIYCKQQSVKSTPTLPAENVHYWQKYLTLQHCEWTCFVKFLFRIYASLLCISRCHLLGWLIDGAVFVYATTENENENQFLHNQPSDPKWTTRSVTRSKRWATKLRIWCKLEKFCYSWLAFDIYNWNTQTILTLCTCTKCQWWITWHCSAQNGVCRSGIMMPFLLLFFGTIHRKKCWEFSLLPFWPDRCSSEKFPLQNNGMIPI